MGSRRSNPSVKPGQKNPIDSNTIRSSSLRDYTPREADHDDPPIARLAPPRIALLPSRRHGVEVGFIFPDPSQEDGEPPRHRDARPLRPAPLHQLEAPALERRWPPDRGQKHVRGLVKIMARHRVSLPRDAKHHVRLAGLVAPGREPQIGSDAAHPTEPIYVLDRRHEGHATIGP